MLNEHLTGQSPENEGSGADVTRSCEQCSKPFVVKANARNTCCGPCFVAKMEDEQRANQPFEAAIWKRQQRAEIWRIVGLVVIIIAVAAAILIRSQSRSERVDRYDQWRKEQGYKSTGY